MADVDKETLLLFFNTCAAIEGKCAEVYHYYSELFQADPEISKLWKKTALEEENHAQQVWLAIKMMDQADRIVLTGGLDRVISVHNKLVTLLNGVKLNPPSLVTALEKSIEAEEHLASLHIDHAVRFKDQATNDLFKALHEADRGHVSELKKQLAIQTLAKTEMVG